MIYCKLAWIGLGFCPLFFSKIFFIQIFGSFFRYLYFHIPIETIFVGFDRWGPVTLDPKSNFLYKLKTFTPKIL
jgi:hypothetical protein